MRLAAAPLLLLLASHPAHAMDAPGADARRPTWPELQSARCIDAIAAAERQHATRPGLLLAIGRAESGRPVPPLPGIQPWPWAVNADGAAMYFDSKAAAVAWTALARQRGVRQLDVGCMQVNLQSHPTAFATLDDAFEPATNAAYAARFLRQLHADAGDWSTATGWYHSRTPARAANYQQRVEAIAAGRTPPPGLGLPLYVRAIQQGSLRIPLAGGGTFRINVARQPSPRPRPRPTACRVAAVLGDFMAPAARQTCRSSNNATPTPRPPLRITGTPG